MSYLRLILDLAVKEPLPSKLADKLSEIQEGIRFIKSFASKINEGKVNEEDTTKAVYHRCLHDEGLPCEPESDI